MTAKELKDTVFVAQYEKVLALLFLTNKQKQLMEMKYIQGLLYKEMADKLNCSEQTIKKEFNRINRKLASLNISKLYE